MTQRSGAQVLLNTAVVGIDKASGGSPGRARYTVQTTSGSTPGDPSTHPTTFDNIIMANPYQFSGISVGDGVLDSPIEEITYVQLHVTIFTSPSPFSPLFFDLPASEKVPGMVLTTLGHGDTPTSGADGAGKAGFFSLSILGKATNPQTQQKEFVYKIFSPEVVTPEFLRYVVNPPYFFRLVLSSGNVTDSAFAADYSVSQFPRISPARVARLHGTPHTSSTRIPRRLPGLRSKVPSSAPGFTTRRAWKASFPPWRRIP